MASAFIFGITNLSRVNLAELLPVTNTVFHLFAYAILTVLWIQCTRLFLAVKAPKAKWFIIATAGPAGFLIIVKLFSAIAGKDFSLLEIIISFGAIAAVVIAFYLGALFHRAKGAN